MKQLNKKNMNNYKILKEFNKVHKKINHSKKQINILFKL